jgi:hypothetical protein
LRATRRNEKLHAMQAAIHRRSAERNQADLACPFPGAFAIYFGMPAAGSGR